MGKAPPQSDVFMPPIRFATDASLGKLGRHLRAAGFDTLCQHQSRYRDFFDRMDTGRVILTRTRAVRARFPDRAMVFIRDNDPLRQMVQVVRELGIRKSDLRPFSRCLGCNTAIRRVDREAVRDRVPAYVWHCHRTFHGCGRCKRIYWAGSHRDRMGTQIARIFSLKEEMKHEC